MSRPAYRVTTQAGESLREIANVSKRSAGLAQDISVAAQEQVKGAEHVGLAVQAIAGVALQTEQGCSRPARRWRTWCGWPRS